MLKDSFNKSYMFNTPILVIIAVLTAVSYLGGLTGIQTVISFSFAISIVLVIGLSVLDICIRKRVDPLLLIIVAAMVLPVVSGGLKDNFDYYKSFLITLCTFISISYAPKIRMEKWGRMIISCMFFIMAVITLVMFYFMGYDKVYFGTTQSIAFYFGNPNAAGLWILGIYIINGCFLFKQKWWMKIVYILILAGLLHIIFRTESRNSLISAIVFLGALVLYQFIKNRKMPKWLLFVAVVAPIIAFVVYMYVILPIADNIIGLFGMDKGINTRERIWSSVINEVKEHLLFGRYDLYHGGNLHNSFLTLLGMYGLPLVVSSCWLMYRSAVMQQEYISPLAAMTFCSLMISGCFEASVFVGIGGFYLAILVMPACFSTDDTKPAEKGI